MCSLRLDGTLTPAAKERPRKTRGLFTLLSVMTLILWTAYPIVFALGEGTNKISADAEIIAYAVLDV
jgi:bacteriorhodopsin